MGTIYKRGNVWWISYYHNGRKIRESSKSDKKMVARRLLEAREGEIAQGKLPSVLFEGVTLKELLEDLIVDYEVNGRRNVGQVRTMVRQLLEYFGDIKAKKVTTAGVNRYIKDMMKEGLKPATINRRLSALKRAFNIAARATPPKVDHVPYIKMLEERNARKGFFSHDEYLAILREMPEHLKPVVMIGYKLGWRKGEILNLQWSNIDFKAATIRLEPNETKNRRGRTAYMDPELVEALTAHRRAQQQNGIITPYLFPNAKGDGPVRNFRRSWLSACERAGVHGRIFHDFRRTAVRNMVRAGVSEHVAMQISGHLTASVFRRYDIVSEDDLRTATRKVSEYVKNQTGTISGTVTKLRNVDGDVTH